MELLALGPKAESLVAYKFHVYKYVEVVQIYVVPTHSNAVLRQFRSSKGSVVVRPGPACARQLLGGIHET